MASVGANTLTLISGEILANSLGGSVVANSVQVANTTRNGTVIEFLLAGQSLPIQYGSGTVYPPVQISIYAGANGNTQDQLLVSGNVYPTGDQGGSFIVNGILSLRANGAGGGANANQVWGSVMQMPVTQFNGDVKGIVNVYGGAGSNGNSNVELVGANTCNISFFAQPQTGQNTNVSITSLVIFAPTGVI